MKLAVLSTLPWPYVRRGNRCVYELGAEMARRGHEVSIIQPSPGPRRHEEIRDGMRAIYIPLPDHPVLTAFKIQRLATFGWLAAEELRRSSYDVVQTLHPVDAFAAARFRARTGTPFVHMVIDCNPFHPEFRLGKWMFQKGIRAASHITAPSRFLAGLLQHEWGYAAEVVPPPTNLSLYAISAPKAPGVARILCTAAMGDARKRVGLLVQGFECLLQSVPHAELWLCGHGHEHAREALLATVGASARSRIRVLGPGRPEDLPTLYAESTISVLPSLNETFGLVVTESLASGTPVVGTQSGAIPEILDNPEVGVLFPEDGGPDVVGRALHAGLRLAYERPTPERCRAHVEARYGFQALGDRYESIYAEVVRHAGRPAAQADAPPLAAAVAGRDFLDVLDRMDLGQEAYFRALASRRGLRALMQAVAQEPTAHKGVLVAGANAAVLSCWMAARGLSSMEFGAASEPRAENLRGAPLWVLEYATEPTSEIIAACAASACEVVIAVLPSVGRGGDHLQSAFAAAGLQQVASRRIEAQTAYEQSFGSTPVKRWLSHGVPYHLRRWMPCFRRSRLVIWRRLRG